MAEVPQRANEPVVSVMEESSLTMRGGASTARNNRSSR